MKKKTSTVVAILALFCIGEKVMAGPFEDALAAARQGDYASAYRLWLPLAEQGDCVYRKPYPS